LSFTFYHTVLQETWHSIAYCLYLFAHCTSHSLSTVL